MDQIVWLTLELKPRRISFRLFPDGEDRNVYKYIDFSPLVPKTKSTMDDGTRGNEHNSGRPYSP